MNSYSRADEDTIYAPATAAGRGAIAIIRISGPGTRAIFQFLVGGVPVPRRASLRSLKARDGEVLDRALALWFPGPGSYTGEDMAELHLHAGPAVIEGVADALAALGARPAEPGEFTQRAFFNGRMDLLEAEAIGDLVEAESASQRRQALRQMDGALGAIYAAWAARLLSVVAQQEALIDFPDEDLPPDVEAALVGEIAALREEIAAHLADGHRGERVRDGLSVVIAGPPNAGKSSLINALVGREVAITSPMAGTTRDALDARLVLGGVLMTLTDTAGLRASADPVEVEGVRRARDRVARADLVLALTEATGTFVEPGEDSKPGQTGLETNGVAPLFRIVSKIDLGGAVPPGSIGISVRTGEGLDRLRRELAAWAEEVAAAAGPPPLTRTRHRVALERAFRCLEAAFVLSEPELRGEELRAALRALGTITGEVGVEEVLGAIFSSFCIGK